MTDQAEQAARWQPFDPRDFTVAEWGLIINALNRHSQLLRRKAEGRCSEQYRKELLDAAARYSSVAYRAVAARVFCRDQPEGQLQGGTQ